MTGCYTQYFRTGGNSNNVFLAVHNSLNTQRGTGYDVSEGGIVWCENLALAKVIAYLWQANKTMTLNFDPQSMFSFINRWEKILNIQPLSNQTIVERQRRIAVQFLLFSKPPTPQNVVDFLKLIIPRSFINVEYNNPLNNQGFFPGGLSVPGGVTLADGPFMSYLNQIIIRIWQPRDHNNNLLMTNGEFQNQQKVFYTFLNNYLPTYVGYKALRFFTQGPGTITMTTGSSSVVGISTTFLTTFDPGDRFETVDDLGNVRTYTVSSVSDNTHLQVSNILTFNNTNGYYRINNGFFLDIPQNLDNLEMNA